MKLKARFGRMALSGLSAAILAAGLGLVARPAAADSIVFNSGAPGLSSFYSAQAGQTYTMAASAFQLASGAAIDGAQWWGTCFVAASCPSTINFTVGFYSDNAGAPGTLLHQFQVSGNQTATGNKEFGFLPQYAYSAAFSPFSIAAKTDYWFVLAQNQTESATWGVESTAATGSHLEYGSQGWLAASGTAAFTLSGETGTVATPEPSSLFLLLAGLACFGLFTLRKQSGIRA